jgi:hypothetical protein
MTMGQIMFSRNPTGRIGLGLFLLALSAFVYSIFDPLFGPLAMGCIVAGVGVGVLLSRRRTTTLHIDPGTIETARETPRPIEPR